MGKRRVFTDEERKNITEMEITNEELKNLAATMMVNGLTTNYVISSYEIFGDSYPKTLRGYRSHVNSWWLRSASYDLPKPELKIGC